MYTVHMYDRLLFTLCVVVTFGTAYNSLAALVPHMISVFNLSVYLCTPAYMINFLHVLYFTVVDDPLGTVTKQKISPYFLSYINNVRCLN